MMDKQQAMTTILDELNSRHFQPDDFDGDALDAALALFDTRINSYNGTDYGDALPLAAALAYFGGNDALTVDDFTVALQKAVRSVNCGDYTWDADVETVDYLGEVFFYKKTKAKSFYGLEDYVDFERLGEDILNDTGGKFTRYGFFAPTEIF